MHFVSTDIILYQKKLDAHHSSMRIALFFTFAQTSASSFCHVKQLSGKVHRTINPVAFTN